MEADDAARASSPPKYKNSPPAKLPISFDGDGAAACDDGADDDARLAAALQQAEYDDDDAAGADLPPALPLTRSASMSDIDKVALRGRVLSSFRFAPRVSVCASGDYGEGEGEGADDCAGAGAGAGSAGDGGGGGAGGGEISAWQKTDIESPRTPAVRHGSGTSFWLSHDAVDAGRKLLKRSDSKGHGLGNAGSYALQPHPSSSRSSRNAGGGGSSGASPVVRQRKGSGAGCQPPRVLL